MATPALNDRMLWKSDDPACWNAFMATQETFPQIVERRAAATPDRNFMTCVTGESATWAQMQESGRLWAARLASLGVRRGDVVATLIDTDVQSTAIWLGICKLGAVDAAVSSEFRGRLLAYAISNCEPKLVIAKADYLPLLEPIAGELTTIRHVLVIGASPSASVSTALHGVVPVDDVGTDVPDLDCRLVQPSWHDAACITYTSGTTGPAKAVVIAWAQLHCVNIGTFPLDDLNETDVIYGTTTHAHFGSKSLPYLTALVGGRAVTRSRFSASSFWNDVERFGVTTVSLVGTMADTLLRQDGPAKSSLRNVFMAPLGPAYRRFNERFGTRVCTVYSSSENGVAVASGWNPSNPHTVGKRRAGYPGFEVRIVDEHDHEVPDGTIGEFIVRSAVPWTLSSGYHNNPEATANAWRNGWLHTGDAFFRDEHGDYIFVDRLKDVIRRRGENISSYEVETDVLRNPDVIECAAVATKNPRGEEEVLLFVVRRPGSSITAAELWSDLEKRMPRFMIPRYVEFVDALPKTDATARIVKAELRKRGIGPHTSDRLESCGPIENATVVASGST